MKNKEWMYFIIPGLSIITLFTVMIHVENQKKKCEQNGGKYIAYRCLKTQDVK